MIAQELYTMPLLQLSFKVTKSFMHEIRNSSPLYKKDKKKESEKKCYRHKIQ